MKTLLAVTAALEAGVGLLLALMPALPIWLLLGVPPDSAAASVVARLVGLALLSLGVGCRPVRVTMSRAAPRAVVAAMLLYHVTATALFIYTRIGLGLSGLALWRRSSSCRVRRVVHRVPETVRAQCPRPWCSSPLSNSRQLARAPSMLDISSVIRNSAA